jgi:DNA mismatch repair protein MutS
MTTLLQQYFAIKAKYKEAVLLFRVGDFYETFNEDAETVSRILGTTLSLTEQDPDIKAGASLPHYTLDTALHKLVKAGYKVAICDQLEAPKAGPMKRGVTGLFSE